MRLPRLRVPTLTRTTIGSFGGYHHSLRIGSGEFYDMTNLCSDSAPVLSPRAPRRRVGTARMAPERTRGGLVDLDGLCYVEDGRLYYPRGGKTESADLGLTEGRKRLVCFGAYLIVLPDKKYLNTADPDDRGSIDASMTVFNARAPFYDPDEDATFDTLPFGPVEPSDPSDGDRWADTSVQPAQQRRYSAQSGVWRAVRTYYRLPAEGLGALFRVGDGVHVRSITGEVFFASAEVVQSGEDGLVIAAPPVRLVNPSYVISREMPELDFCFAHENRLWGCRYGVGRDGAFVNEIRASKLGDFRNWNSFHGVSTDSYAVSCGTEGEWTGAVSALGYPLFFKENWLHKVYGSTPANFQTQIVPCRGVMSGCGGSLAVVNAGLYYKARGGVMRYDGALPSEVSEALGDGEYYDAIACGYRNKYYISMRDGAGEWNLFVLDTRRGMWHREDALHAEAFCATSSGLYYLEAEQPWLRAVEGGDDPLEEQVPWSAETGQLGIDSPDRKYISRINVRLSMARGSRVRFFAAYDSGDWELLAELSGEPLHCVSVPLRPKRCDHLRLRIEGLGDAKLYALTLCAEEGSDLR